MDNVRTLMGDPLGVQQWSDTRGVSQGTVGAPFAYAALAADLINGLRLHAGMMRQVVEFFYGMARVCTASRLRMTLFLWRAHRTVYRL